MAPTATILGNEVRVRETAPQGKGPERHVSGGSRSRCSLDPLHGTTDKYKQARPLFHLDELS